MSLSESIKQPTMLSPILQFDKCTALYIRHNIVMLFGDDNNAVPCANAVPSIITKHSTT